MTWVQDSTKTIKVGIGEMDDNTKWILIGGALLILAYLLMKQGGKK